MGLCRRFVNENSKLNYLPLIDLYFFPKTTIESAHLYHFWPGHKIHLYHLGGINFRHSYARDFHFYKVEKIGDPLETKKISFREVKGIFFGGFEPLLDRYFVEKILSEVGGGVKKIFETIGFLSISPMRGLIGRFDAVLINFYGYNNEIYHKIFALPRGFDHALSFLEFVKEAGLHIEITYNVIPEKNTDLERFSSFLKDVIDVAGDSTPLHILRGSRNFPFQESYAQNKILEKLWKIATLSNGMKFVYIDGLYQSHKNYTRCPESRKVIIEHHGPWIKVRWENLDETCMDKLNLKGEIKETLPFQLK
ncbi:MAG: radical SAM protein [Candidatus Njordarchaeia archaeon]